MEWMELNCADHVYNVRHARHAMGDVMRMERRAMGRAARVFSRSASRG